MHSMCVQAVLAVLLLFTATVKTEVQFWKETVTLTCPGEDTFKWFDKKGADLKENSSTYEFTYNGKARYYCEFGDSSLRYDFYVEGKTCENCFELDANALAVAIVADMIGTAVVMMIIFKCTKKRNSAGPTHSSKAPARSVSTAPPVPSPDYEQLNPHTVSQDPYSVVNRMG